MHYLKLLRVHQYVKNCFIFLPLFFALRFTEIELVLKSIIAFSAFSLVASAVYIINDIKDIKEDKEHPKKKFRPIASGKVSVFQSWFFMTFVLIAGMGLAYYQSVNLLKILGFYFVLNIFYTLWLKHIAPLDIFIIATGFLLRIMAGTDYAGITGIIPSHWIIVMTFLLALFLAFAKRRDDVILAAEGRTTRKSIKGYNLEFINSAMSIMAAVIIVSYILYAMSPDVTDHFKSQNIYLSVIFVILGIFRYLQITFVYNKSGNPTEIVLKDRFIQGTILGWISMFIYLVY